MTSNIIKVAYANFIVLLGTGGARALAFLTSIILARVLGAEGFGQFSLFQSAMFISWQIPQAFDTAFIRYAKAEDSNQHIKECLAVATRLKIIFAALMIVGAYPVGKIILYFNPDSPELGKLALQGIVCGAFLCFLNSVANLMRVKEQFGRYSILQGVYNLTVLCVVVIMGYLLKILTVELTIITLMCIAVFYGIGSLWFVIRVSGNPFKSYSIFSKKLFNLAKWVLLTVVAFYFFSRIDILMISFAITFEEVGIYSSAGQLILIVSLMIGAVSTVFMPRSVNAVKSKAALRSYIMESIIPLAIIGGGILFLYLSAPLFFSMIFTAEYKEGATILRILLLGYVFVAVYTPLSFLFYAMNRPDLRFYLEASKLVMAIALLYFIIPIYGLVGAAWSMSACMAINSIFSTIVLGMLLKRQQYAD